MRYSLPVLWLKYLNFVGAAFAPYVVFGAALLLFAWLMGNAAANGVKFWVNGTRVTGTVVSKRASALGPSAPAPALFALGKRITYSLQYQYTDHGGATHTGWADVSRTNYDKATAGDPIEILYLPENPGRSMPVLLATGAPLWVLGALAFSGGVAYCVWGVLSTFRLINRLTYLTWAGTAVRATVTKRPGRRAGYGKCTSIEYEYAWPDRDGGAAGTHRATYERPG